MQMQGTGDCDTDREANREANGNSYREATAYSNSYSGSAYKDSGSTDSDADDTYSTTRTYGYSDGYAEETHTDSGSAYDDTYPGATHGDTDHDGSAAESSPNISSLKAGDTRPRESGSSASFFGKWNDPGR